MKYQGSDPIEHPNKQFYVEKGKQIVITPTFVKELDTCIVKMPTNDYLYSSASTKDNPLEGIMR